MKNIYVSPNGMDSNTGTKESPFKSIQKAVDAAVRSNREYWDGQAVVNLMGGVYEISAPVTISGDVQVTITSAPGEKAVISGGRTLENVVEGELNGMRLWTVDLPQVREGKWYFKSLFAGETRRPRACLPREGFYWMEDVPGHTVRDALFDGANRFIAKEGDMQMFRNLTDAEIHAFHYWTDEHMPIASYNPETREVVCTHQSVFALKDDEMPRFPKYRIENIFEGLLEAGDWYLDRAEGKLYYLPEEQETLENTRLIAPVTEQLLVAKDISGLTIDNVAFAYTDWSLHQNMRPTFPQLKDEILYASAPQGNSNLPGVVSFRNAKYCAVTRCEIRHIGLYAVDLEYNCKNMRIQGNVISDMGAGGVKLNGATATEPREERTQYITVADNDIGLGGRVFLAGIGVISLHANHIRIAHNHIHDLYYSGVSCGWQWDYDEGACWDNTIEYNYIHGLGHGILSDMGGIYTLSVQPGTVIRNNLIHDIEKANYGGWAIYPDEGSSHILIENNVSFDTSSSSFHQHYGRENIVRNNIWAFGKEGMIHYTRSEDHGGFTFERNIVLTKGEPIYTGGGIGNIHSDMNLFWDVDQAPIEWCGSFKDRSTYRPIETVMELGYDICSQIADPMFEDVENRNFTLKPESPAFKLGFKQIDLSTVGVRAEDNWD
ncbi:MAG: right-handed parallel beta-helix repeat-containing protein [Clostridia bacterium]|nr:right-handed parallel beta-helix repeat-containing protein [Clostridia bacterium]